jgi:hypothetical protein
MSFTYDFTNNPNVAYVRLLVFDTNGTAPYPIWQDEEITAALQLFSSSNIIVGLSGYTPAVAVPQAFSYRRTAAMLLRGLAANQGRMATVGLLDAKLNGPAAAKALQSIADDYVTSEENDGYFAVAEMVQDSFSMRERLWKMLYRQNNC